MIVDELPVRDQVGKPFVAWEVLRANQDAPQLAAVFAEGLDFRGEMLEVLLFEGTGRFDVENAGLGLIRDGISATPSPCFRAVSRRTYALTVPQSMPSNRAISWLECPEQESITGSFGNPTAVRREHIAD